MLIYHCYIGAPSAADTLKSSFVLHTIGLKSADTHLNFDEGRRTAWLITLVE